jgi:type I restriction enzyme S subunit
MATLGDYITIKHGYAFKGAGITNEDNGVVLVTPGNFSIGGGFKEGKCKFFNGEYPSEYVLSPNDLIVTMTDLSKEMDTLGYSALVPESNRVYLHNQRIGLISINREDLDKHYLYWFMRTRNYQRTIAGGASGTTVHHTSPGRICEVEVDFPDLLIQKKIAGLMDSIEEKIRKNEKINENLFQQAQALYKDRFVDMQPFDGEMPADWHLGTVSEIIELHDSKRIPLSSRERANLAKVYPYYGATSVMDYVDRYLFDGIYLLLGEDGTVVDSKGFPILQYVEGKFWVNNHAHIITGKNDFTVETLYLLFSLTNVQSIVTGAVQLKISQANLNKVPVIIPSKAELSAFDSIAQPIFAQIRNLRAENDRLAAIRDTLLPRLMSGELDVSDIDL